MAEYSAEYLKNYDWKISPDFSIQDVFSKLKLGESVDKICEGYGFVKISNVNDTCLLTFNDGTSKFYHDLM